MRSIRRLYLMIALRAAFPAGASPLVDAMRGGGVEHGRASRERAFGMARQLLRVIVTNPVAQGLTIHPVAVRRLRPVSPLHTSANASILRDAFASFVRDASRRSSAAENSVRVMSTAMPILLPSSSE